jgi:hypothetical protein
MSAFHSGIGPQKRGIARGRLEDPAGTPRRGAAARALAAPPVRTYLLAVAPTCRHSQRFAPALDPSPSCASTLVYLSAIRRRRELLRLAGAVHRRGIEPHKAGQSSGRWWPPGIAAVEVRREHPLWAAVWLVAIGAFLAAHEDSLPVLQMAPTGHTVSFPNGVLAL